MALLKPVANYSGEFSVIQSGDVIDTTAGGTGLSSFTTNSYFRALNSSTLEQRTPAQVLSDIGALAVSSYTAADVLAKLLTVDGTGIELDTRREMSPLRVDIANILNRTFHVPLPGGGIYPVPAMLVMGAIKDAFDVLYSEKIVEMEQALIPPSPTPSPSAAPVATPEPTPTPSGA